MPEKTNRKTTIYLPDALRAQWDAFAVNNPDVSLSEVCQEAIRRRVGALTDEDRQADQLGAALAQLKRLDGEVKRLAKSVKALEKGRAS